MLMCLLVTGMQKLTVNFVFSNVQFVSKSSRHEERSRLGPCVGPFTVVTTQATSFFRSVWHCVLFSKLWCLSLVYVMNPVHDLDIFSLHDGLELPIAVHEG